jgi:hypothetical protein
MGWSSPMKSWITVMPGLLTIVVGFGAGSIVAEGRSMLAHQLDFKKYAMEQIQSTPITREISYNPSSVNGYKPVGFNPDSAK